MKPNAKRALLFLGLAATLALVWFAPADGDGAAAPAVEKSQRAQPAAPAASARTDAAPAALRSAGVGQLQAITRTPPVEAIVDVFKSKSWYVPPPPPPPEPPPPPPPPSAPPLPFAYLGQYSDGNSSVILLAQGERILNVAVGAIIDRNYQVLSMKGGRLTFLYLPLQIEQSLITGVSQ